MTKFNIPSLPKWLNRVPWCLLFNLLVLYILYGVCRIVFILDNYDIFGSELTAKTLWQIFKGGFLFDSSAIFYTNILYLLLVLFPLKLKETPIVHTLTKWVYVVTNSICLIANLIDTVYYPFSEKRATWLIYQEFSGNTNGGKIVGIELWNHWYFVLLAALFVFVLIKGYRSADWSYYENRRKQYYIRQSVSMIVIALLTVAGMRGSFFSTSSRPIAMSNAYQYVKKPNQTGIVLNTPFSIIRTAMKRQVSVPKFFDNVDEIEAFYTPMHIPADSVTPNKKNVVVLIVESFAEEFIGARNKDLDGGLYKGYTPFADSLLQVSATFEHTYSNGWISIDAMPSVLSSIPKMYTSFILTQYALDDVPGTAKQLKDWGYYTAFFHGAENSSMGFQAFAKSAGFEDYFGRTEYDQDPRFDGEKDFDGTWAIWDEEFLQYFCTKISEMPQPFFASVFTASSHHPFAIPEKYKDVYKEEGKYPIHKCIRYTDNALRLFFEAAKRQPWYDNTIFVLTADHASSRVTHDEYHTAVGDFRVPILFFDPTGTLEPGTRPGIAQQIDIMPTLLSYLGYDKPYLAFGKDLLTTAPEDTWAFNWHNIPQYIKGDYLLQYNDFEVSGIYKYKTDKLLKHNLVGTDDYDKEYVGQMVRELQALMETCDMRMKTDQLTLRTPNPQKLKE